MESNYKPGSAMHILLNEYYEDSLNRYIKEHPGEWIVVEPREYAEEHLIEEENFLKEEDVIERFFTRKSDLEKFIKRKYENIVGYTLILEKIPDTRK